MPLSEHEQRLLDQIERALYAEDPKFATTVRSTDLRTHMRRRLRRAAVVLVVGVVLLVLGLSTNPAVGIAGFAVMVIALLLGLSALKRLGGNATTLRSVNATSGRAGETGSTRSKPAKRRKGSGSVRERLEQRWNRRWDERGRS